MAPHILSGKVSLSYPLYAVDFDPENGGYLVVGGGGGESRTGVKNRITILNASSQTEVFACGEIDLSTGEDAVTSLGLTQQKGKEGTLSAIALAGINSSAVDQRNGKNHHLRSFNIVYPANSLILDESTEHPIGRVQGSITVASKTSLFTPSPGVKQETYQRVLRLSPAHRGSTKRLCAIATGLAPQGEVVVFDASNPSPTMKDVKKAIKLKEGEEAADIDIFESADNFKVAYCTDYEISIYNTGKIEEKSENPRSVYVTAQPEVFSAGTRGKFRCLRFLTEDLLLLLVNKPKRTGSQLQVIRISQDAPGEVVATKSLPSSAKASVDLSISVLTGSVADNVTVAPKQFVIAVAGQDSSLSIFTLNLTARGLLSKITPFDTIRNVHSGPITKITLSTFHSPPAPVPTNTKPQYIKLASVSIDNTAVVHTLPLRPEPEKSKTPHYVLEPTKSENLSTALSAIFAILVVVVAAVLMQAWLEIRGGSPQYLGAGRYLPSSVRGWVERPYIFEGYDASTSASPINAVVSSMSSAGNEQATKLSDLLSSATDQASKVGETASTVIMQHIVEEGSDGSISADLHDATSDMKEKAKKWEELGKVEKEWWKKKLSEAGHWAAGQGDTVLKGVLFGEIGGAIGQAIAGG